MTIITNPSPINYPKLVDSAMRSIVRKALSLVDVHNSLGEHHFLISFLTDFPGVTLSSRIKQRYPEEMTIVLQYQFESLKVTEEHFSVVLSFDGIKEQITIPFDALTSFVDPDTKFALQFNPELVNNLENPIDDKENKATKLALRLAKLPKKKLKLQTEHTTVTNAEEPKVIILDHFRKNNNK